MDVRCEKCGTEYELDEARLKPGGVTVKCTSCGHMFKIRKRAATNLGMPVIPAPAGPGQAVPRPMTQTGSEPNAERNWIIRLANGEQRSCRELATLQQWIIAGDVNRESMISRSGKTWKQLGDIPELAQFFTLAEQSRTRRDSARVTGEQPAPGGRPKVATPTPAKGAPDKGTLLGIPATPPPRRAATQPPPPPKSLAQHAGPMAPLDTKPANDSRPKPAPVKAPATPPARTPQTTTKSSAGAPVAAPTAPTMLATPPVAAQDPVPAPTPRPTGPSVPPKTPAADASARSTGAWASADVRPIAGDPDSGFGGKVRMENAGAEPGFGGRIGNVPTHDAAFVGGRLPALGGSSARIEPSADEPLLDDDLMPRRSGGAGKWIAIGALAVIAGAAIAVYFVLRPGKTPGSGSGSGTAAARALDAGAVATGADASTPDRPPTGAGDDELVDQARDLLAADVGAELDTISPRLAEGEQSGARLGLRARIATALAQQLEDQAAIAADAKTADKLRKDAKKALADALPLAQKGLKIAPDDASVHVAMADVLRMQARPAKDVQKEIDRALQIAAGDREALLVSAMLAAREKKIDEARGILGRLDSGEGAMEQSGDVRPRFRLAMLAFVAGDAPAATKAAEDVLALQAEHAGAQALLRRLRDTVSATDPMPPEDPDHGGGKGSGSSKGSGSGSGSSKGSSSGEPSGDYDSLLKKADALAEVNCSNAMPYYAKALELKPNGVGALAGRGYCYIDAKSFSSAFSSFRAALAVSPRYEPALWGMAEAYQQQGLKDKAIEAYMKYLEVYPGSAKAKKQIERLGGTIPSEGGGDDPPPEDPPPEKPPDPPPEDPPPDPDPAPSE